MSVQQDLASVLTTKWSADSSPIARDDADLTAAFHDRIRDLKSSRLHDVVLVHALAVHLRSLQFSILQYNYGQPLSEPGKGRLREARADRTGIAPLAPWRRGTRITAEHEHEHAYDYDYDLALRSY